MDIALVCFLFAILFAALYALLPLALVVEAKFASLLLGAAVALIAAGLAFWVNAVKV